jgi:hypothetical protein
MNTTLIQDPLVKEVITETFWWYFPAILADGKISTSVEPLNCSGDSCTSYFLPGPLSIVQFDPSSPMVAPTDYPTATTFIQQDAPGYQLDFYPIGPNDPAFTSDDCRVLGVNILAVQMCLKKTNTALLICTAVSIHTNVSMELMSAVTPGDIIVFEYHGLGSQNII